LALPILLYGSENWTVKSKDKSKLTNRNKVYVKECKTNEEILHILKVNSILDKIKSYKTECIQHVKRIPPSRLANLLRKYALRGIRNQGRPLRLLDE
jgi:hypothetical protein